MDASEINVYRPRGFDIPEQPQPLYLNIPEAYKSRGWDVIAWENLEDDDTDCCTYLCIFSTRNEACAFIEGCQTGDPDAFSYELGQPAHAPFKQLWYVLIFWSDSDPEYNLVNRCAGVYDV